MTANEWTIEYNHEFGRNPFSENVGIWNAKWFLPDKSDDSEADLRGAMFTLHSEIGKADE